MTAGAFGGMCGREACIRLAEAGQERRGSHVRQAGST